MIKSELPKFKRKGFNVKRFKKLADSVRASMSISELAGWSEMSFDDKVEWLKDKIEEIYIYKKYD